MKYILIQFLTIFSFLLLHASCSHDVPNPKEPFKEKPLDDKEYEYVASHTADFEVRDRLLGPKYSFYHPVAEQFPTLELQGDEGGWDGPMEMKPPECLKMDWNKSDEWYTQTGPLIYVADDQNDAGVIRAASGEFFWYKNLTPPYGYLCRLHWGQGASKGWYTETVPRELSHYGNPKKPVAVASATGIEAFQQYVAFQNGVIGTFPTIPAGYSKYGLEFPFVQLPAGKVPMALAVTPANEFILAAVWDVINHKGQMAVIAVQNRVRVSEKRYTGWALDGAYESGSYMFGIPGGYMSTKALKLLGFIDLPVSEPIAIKAGTDLGWTYEGRNNINVNYPLDELLNNQSERDTWYNSDATKYPNFKGTAHSGYAVIASRSEDKVVFVDLQPLIGYYRTMYFTTQARLDSTRILGAADNQWPYTFNFRPAQKPVVTFEVGVSAPTAVAAGFSVGMCTGCMGQCNSDGTISGGGIGAMRPTPYGGQYAYITTMEGKLLIFNVGGLNTEASPSPPELHKTVDIGRNPTSLENGNGGIYKNDLYICCRGDRSVYVVQPDGTVQYVLRDSRINDPVMAEPSVIGRQYTGIPVRGFIHVVDFSGKAVLTYVHDVNFTTPVKFGAAAYVPGYPFAYQQDEVQ